MLMLELDQGEMIFLPAADRKETRIEIPRQSDTKTNPVTIAIPDLKETDQIILVIAGRRHSILGGKKRSAKTRLALALPEDCQIRYINRERKPRKDTTNV